MHEEVEEMNPQMLRSSGKPDQQLYSKVVFVDVCYKLLRQQIQAKC